MKKGNNKFGDEIWLKGFFPSFLKYEQAYLLNLFSHPSNIQTTRQLLHPIKQCIALSDRSVEQFGFFVGSVGLDNTGNFVNLTIETAIVNEI